MENLTKILKQKRDAEDRLRQTSQQPSFVERVAGSQVYQDFSSFATKAELALKAAIDHVHTFLDLTDTPTAYTGQGGKAVKVKADETGLEFGTVSGGSGAFDYGYITDMTTTTQDWGTIV